MVRMMGNVDSKEFIQCRMEFFVTLYVGFSITHFPDLTNVLPKSAFTTHSVTSLFCGSAVRSKYAPNSVS